MRSYCLLLDLFCFCILVDCIDNVDDFCLFCIIIKNVEDVYVV